MKIPDAKMPKDSIAATLRHETHGDFVDIVIVEDGATAGIYLSKADATCLGRFLIELGEEPETTL